MALDNWVITNILGWKYINGEDEDFRGWLDSNYWLTPGGGTVPWYSSPEPTMDVSFLPQILMAINTLEGDKAAGYSLHYNGDSKLWFIKGSALGKPYGLHKQVTTAACLAAYEIYTGKEWEEPDV